MDFKQNKNSFKEYESWDNLFKDVEERVGGNPAYQKAAASLRGYRGKEGFSQKTLADLLKTTQSNISAIENARYPVGKRLAKKLAMIKQSLFILETLFKCRTNRRISMPYSINSAIKAPQCPK
ncbi:helix-turn-helix transcriptional regulator [bacterium]|nr:helix-turn-helix transcriptional regulator [bacterium]